MNKKLKKIAALLCVIFCLTAVAGCSSKGYTITFRQEGKPDIVRTVSRGEALTDVPDIEPVPGYTVVWSVEDFSSISEDMVVEVVKTPNKYTITYDKGREDAELSVTSQEVTYGQTCTLAKPTCKGYTFSKWVIKGTTEELKDGVYGHPSDVTLVAQWIPSQYTITYDKGMEDAELGAASQDVTYGQPYTLAKPTCKGYTFVKWVIKGTTEAFEDGVYDRTSNVTLTAVWIPNVYTITYETGNDRAQIAQTQQKVTFGEAFTLEEATCEGYFFRGWQIVGTQEVLQSGQQYLNAGDITLAALWEKDPDSEYWNTDYESGEDVPVKTHTITFRQEGKPDVVRTVLHGGALYNVPTPAPVPGYTVSWSVEDFSSISEDMVIEVVKTPKQYTITYDKGRGDAELAVTSQGVNFGQDCILAKPTCTGYTFVKWVIKGTTEELKDGIYDRTSDVTLVAEWTPSKYLITYDVRNDRAQIDRTQQTVVYGEPYTLETPVCDGYVFKGWKTYLWGTILESGEKYEITADITLIAQWEIDVTSDDYWVTDFEADEADKPAFVTVTFRQEGKPDVVRKVLKGKPLNSVPDPEQILGYTVCWSVEDFSSFTKDVVVEVVKIPNQYTITYEKGRADATLDVTSQPVAYGTAYTLARPTCTGYTFVKWVIKGTENVFEDGTYNLTSDVTLTAVWKANDYTITYDKGRADAVLDKTNQTVTYDAPYTLAEPTCKGYSFKGWKIKDTETAFASGEKYQIADNITLVAQWEIDATSDHWVTDFEADEADRPQFYTVTFVQTDGTTVTRKVLKGKPLNNVPDPAPVAGHTVSWDVTDFSSITGDMTVTAVQKIIQYTITYETGNDRVSTAPAQQTVNYGESFTVAASLSCEGYTFKGWKIQDTEDVLDGGTSYQPTASVTLIGVWEMDATSDYWITDFEEPENSETVQ